MDQMRDGGGMTREICRRVRGGDGALVRVPVSELGSSPATSQAEAASELPLPTL